MTYRYIIFATLKVSYIAFFADIFFLVCCYFEFKKGVLCMLRLILLMGMVSCFSAVHAFDMVTVHSNSTLFPKGQQLESNSPINIPADTEITVVFTSGEALTVKGPYQGQLRDPAQNNPVKDTKLIQTLSDMIIQQAQSAKRPSKTSVPDNLWSIDVSARKRHYCVTSDHITLWRPASESDIASDLLIKHKSSGQAVKAVWPAHQSTLNWPSSLPVVYGDTYTVEVTSARGSSSFKKVILYQLPSNLPTKSHKVVWMVGRGCIPQANMLLASVR
jgi:hypothetical protein